MSGLPKLPDVSVGSPSAGGDTSRLATTKNLEAAGQKFEAVFTGMMLKAMRAPKLADDLFGSKAQDQFRDMWDAKTVEAMAAHTPLGIGKAMTAFLARANPALAGAAPAVPGAAVADPGPNPVAAQGKADLNQGAPQG